MREEIESRVNEILFRFLGSFDVRYETTAKDVEGWDSLTHMKIINAIQKEFGLKFTMGELRGFSCVGKIYDTLMKRVAS